MEKKVSRKERKGKRRKQVILKEPLKCFVDLWRILSEGKGGGGDRELGEGRK